MDGDGSESANSSGVSILELLSCEMDYKTEIFELVSEFMLDDILIVGKSGWESKKWDYCVEVWESNYWDWSVEVGWMGI